MTQHLDLPRQLVAALKNSNLTISTAESCTGGLIAKQITDVPGCSSVFHGGCVTYTNQVKTELLGVDPKIFDTYTEVSEACAKAMAEGIRHRLKTDMGISTTGYAGPDGGTESDPVGTVYISLATSEKTICKRIQAPPSYDRSQVRALATETALQMVLDNVKI